MLLVLVGATRRPTASADLASGKQDSDSSAFALVVVGTHTTQEEEQLSSFTERHRAGVARHPFWVECVYASMEWVARHPFFDLVHGTARRTTSTYSSRLADWLLAGRHPHHETQNQRSYIV
jgi:hypothetical protein